MAFTCYFCKIFETLTHTVSEARAKTEYPWLVIKADGNIVDFTIVSMMYLDLTKHLHPPPQKKHTQGDAKLDFSYTNFKKMTESSLLAKSLLSH